MYVASKVREAVKPRRLTLIGSFTWSESPGNDVYQVEICRLSEPTSGTRVRRDYPQRRVVPGHANGEQAAKEGPYITISSDLCHGAGRERRRAFRESLLKRLS